MTLQARLMKLYAGFGSNRRIQIFYWICAPSTLESSHSTLVMWSV
jgi:hypothetical protein